MNIKILDSWLREYVKTQATPKQIAQALSLTSVSVERLERYEKDFTYDIEVTTNRPDLMSVQGLARETAAVLPQFKARAEFKKLDPKKPLITNSQDVLPHITYEPPMAISPAPADTPENAEAAALVLKEKYNVPILYGGSVTAENIRSFTQMPHIDGALVGRASLTPSEFLKIIENA